MKILYFAQKCALVFLVIIGSLIAISGCSREPGADFTVEGAITKNSLIPQPQTILPQTILHQQGGISLNSGLDINLSACDSEDLRLRLLDWQSLIQSQYSVAVEFRFNSSNAELQDSPRLVIECDQVLTPYGVNQTEAYQLTINSNEGINLNAETSLGALHGITTLSQWLTANLQLPAVVIEDSPTYPWRGLMVDVARHFIPLPDLLRQIDAMAQVKMNVLHLHLSDDQGFRIESKVFPLLNELGSEGEYYTQEQIEQIINYAARKAIRVVPEFDIPGHSTSWLVGYPELGSKPGPFELRRRFAISDNALNPASQEVINFIEALFLEMGNLFPDNYFHIGGDEVNDLQWRNNESIQAFMREQGFSSSHELQIYFINRVAEILQSQGKTVIGWREVLDAHLNTDVVVQNWDTFPPVRNTWSIVNIMEAGHSAIQSGGYYLDHQLTAAQHYQYSIAGKPDLPETGATFLGAEAALWTEFIDASNIDYRVWPRAAAIAERLWSRNTTGIGDLYRRLNSLDIQLTALGIRHRSDYQMRIQDWAGDYYDPALDVLIDALSPLQLWRHFSLLWTTTDRPLLRLADIADLDNPQIVSVHGDINRLIAGEDPWEQLERIKIYFQSLRQNYASVKELLAQTKRLRELKGPARDLDRLAGLALSVLLAAEANQPFNPTNSQQLTIHVDPLWRLEEVDVEIRPLVKKLVLSLSTIQRQLHGQ